MILKPFKTMIRWFRNRSIFLKLALVTFLTAIIVFLVIVITFHVLDSSEKGREKWTDNFFISYTDFVIDEIGTPPDMKKAGRIADRLMIMMRIEGGEKSWSTSPLMPKSDKINTHRFRHKKDIRFGRYQRRFYVLVNRGEYQYIFTPDFSFRFPHSGIILLWVLFVLAVIFTISYFILKKILSPIKELKLGVEKVGQGEFDYHVPIKNRDELGQLSTAFNTMTEKIKEMLKGKEQLLLDVSHELRSPITRIRVALEFLKEGREKEMIVEDIQIMQSMLTELLESARMESEYGKLKITATDLCKLISNGCQKIDFHAKNIQQFLPESPLIYPVDISRMEICLNNLLINAIKYSADSKESAQIYLERTESAITIRVKDFGQGIPKEDLPFIFEPFYRVDKSRSKKTGGYGLGLSLCKQIVEAHNGSIQMKSELNQGTEVIIELPI